MGRPRDKWLDKTINEYWKEVVISHRKILAVEDFDKNRQSHVKQVKEAAARQKEKFVILKD